MAEGERTVGAAEIEGRPDVLSRALARDDIHLACRFRSVLEQPQARDVDLAVLFAAFDFHTGRKPQAPRWMQRNGLEWLFRLLTEPRRLWWRYLINNPLFTVLVMLQLLGVQRDSLDSVPASPCFAKDLRPGEEVP